MLRNEFIKLFKPYNEMGKQIWSPVSVKEIPDCVINMGLRLAELDFITYVRICGEYLSASSDSKGKRIPLVNDWDETATGIKIIYDVKYKSIDFYSISSPTKGQGGKMVEVVLSELPKKWQPAVVMDWSHDFWDKMEAKHSQFKWLR